MNSTELVSFFERDLNKLISEIELYREEGNIWRVQREISNSAGNLVLHLIGNLNALVGNEIGKSNYVRDRDGEFSQKNIPRAVLIENIRATLAIVKQSVMALSDEDLKKTYPVLKFSENCTNEFLLVHLATHLAYHLGQINYHRRLIEE